MVIGTIELIREVDIEIDSENDFMDEYLVNCELFCKNKNGTHDSFTLK